MQLQSDKTRDIPNTKINSRHAIQFDTKIKHLILRKIQYFLQGGQHKNNFF